MSKPTEQPHWRRARRCASGSCIEVAKIGESRYLIRDSKNPYTPPLEFTEEEWVAFVGGVEDGDFRFE
jgi:hypothetical protein